MPLVTAVHGQHRRSDRNGLHAVWRQHMLLPSNCNPREREWAQACGHRSDGAIKDWCTCPLVGTVDALSLWFQALQAGRWNYSLSA